MRPVVGNDILIGSDRTDARGVHAKFVDAATAAGVLSTDRLLIASRDLAVILGGIVHGLENGCQVAVTTPDQLATVENLLVGQNGFAVLRDTQEYRNGSPASELPEEQPAVLPSVPGIVVLTSGTTGRPKPIIHSWESLVTRRGKSTAAPRRWLVTYIPGTYAWYQMIVEGLFVSQQHLLFPLSARPSEQFMAALSGGVSGISATPTWWRSVLFDLPDSTISSGVVDQITIGGERVDQPLLNQLRDLFPAARLTHIYASSEVGPVAVVHDGKAGFPLTWLDRRDPDRPEMKIEDDILWVRSPYRSPVLGSEWYCTRDRVRISGDRVQILGRDSDPIANVGGFKVDCRRIELEILQHPKVMWAEVYPKRAPLVGDVVAARVVLSDHESPDDPWNELTAFLRSTGCVDQAIPRRWERLTEVPIGRNLKSRLEGSGEKR